MLRIRDYITEQSLVLFVLTILSVGSRAAHEVGGLDGEMSIGRAAARLRGEEVTIVRVDDHQKEGTVPLVDFRQNQGGTYAQIHAQLSLVAMVLSGCGN